MVARLIRPPSSHHFSVRLTLRPGPDAAAKQCRVAKKCKKCPRRRLRSADALQRRAEEGAGDAHVVVVGRADVHHQVGGRAQPVPAAEGVASPRRQRVGAHDVPGEGAQGHGVALQLEASHRKAGRGHWLLERTRKFPSVVSVGSSSASPRVASVTSSAPPSRNSCFSSSAEAAVSSSSAVLPASRVASRIWRP